MAYIDPKGMFTGDRMRMLSDSARLAWPWFWCATNTMGRIELNYHAVIATAFGQFKKKPTEVQFWKWVQEFQDAFLLFVYQWDGQTWGQWDVSEKYLPTYKLTADKNTPAPNAKEFLEWKKRYISLKASKTGVKPTVISDSKKVSEKFPKDFEETKTVRKGIGIGEGVGIDSLKPSCAADAAPSPDTLIDLTPPEPQYGPAWFDREHSLWYREAYWRRVAPRDSRRAYEKRVRILVKHGMTHDEAAQFLRLQAVNDKTRFEDTPDWDWRQNLHPATWLNGERWNDEPANHIPRQYGRTDAVKALALQNIERTGRLL